MKWASELVPARVEWVGLWEVIAREDRAPRAIRGATIGVAGARPHPNDATIVVSDAAGRRAVRCRLLREREALSFGAHITSQPLHCIVPQTSWLAHCSIQITLPSLYLMQPAGAPFELFWVEKG